MAKNEMKTIELTLKVDLKVKVDPSHLKAFEARLADNTPRDAAASQLLDSVDGKGWKDTVPNRRMLLASSENLKAVLEAAGFKTAIEKEEQAEKARIAAKEKVLEAEAASKAAAGTKGARSLK